MTEPELSVTTDTWINPWLTTTTRLPRSEWPSTSHRGFFLLDRDHPESLYASVIDVYFKTSQTWASGYTYLVNCPSTKCSTDFVEQTITHRDGSVWEGERADHDATTKWLCNLATFGFRRSSPYSALCTSTTGRDLQSVTLPTTPPVADMGHCSVDARSVLVHITAGLDKVYDVFNGYHDEGWDAEELQKMFSEAADSVCPASWTVIPATAAKTTKESSTATSGSSSTEKRSSERVCRWHGSN